MSIRTVEQLYDNMSDELAWRRIELTTLRALISDERLADTKKRALIRGGITLLYAHWEGFCKAASSAYLEFVAMQKMKYSELAINFVAIGVRPLLNTSLQTNRARLHNDLVTKLTKNLDERSNIPYKTSVNTRSNLSSAVLKDIVDTLGLDYSRFATKEKLIDEKLLKSRNHIAHGNFLSINEGDFINLHDQVLELMVELRNQIDNAAAMGLYKAS